MKISQRAIPYIRLTILLLFVVVSLVFYAIFYIAAGGKLPIVAPTPYQVIFQSPINKNLVDQSTVTVNGVPVGNVQKVEVVGGLAQVTVGFNSRPEVAPLHEGVKAAVKTKTLINETYIDITDGNGPVIPDGTTLPPGNVAPPVDTDELLRALPSQDRQALAGALQSLQGATADNQAGISQVLGSIGPPTSYVPAALTALSNQEQSLRQLSANTAKVLGALDTRQGQIADLVRDANTVTKVTAGSADDIRTVIRKLTPTLQTAQAVSPDLSRLGFALQPVADNLNKSAGPLNAALAQLPPTAKDLRTLLPFLDDTLRKAPPTLKRVPPVAGDLRRFVPPANGFFDALNPILAYIKPCAPNILPFFTNFGPGARGSTGFPDTLPIGRVNPIFGADSIQAGPIASPKSPVSFNYVYRDNCSAPRVPFSR